MGLFYPGVVNRRLSYGQGRHIGNSSLMWITLTLWIASTAAQDSTPTTWPPCSGTYVDSGDIQSPNYPLDYPINARCTWHLLAKSNFSSVRIHFNNFSLEKDYDFIYIYDEKNFSRRYTGNTFPPTMLLGNKARIEFFSDGSIVMPGFRVRFESQAITSPNQCTTSDTFWCQSNRKCISINWRCDGYADCRSREDELWCSATSPPTTTSAQNYCQRVGSFWCDRSLKCVPLSYRCDGYNDCTYGEDEANCLTTTTATLNYCQRAGSFWCDRSFKCVPSSYRCNGYNDCTYGEDEANCLTTTTSAQNYCQRVGSFWCVRSLKCVPSSYRCDGDNDCTYGEDEANCLKSTLSPQSECNRIGNFWCSRSYRCVPMSYKCDNAIDCTYGEDEANCSNVLQQQCQQMQRFWCTTSRQCINSLWRCDNADDCLYGEDELGCNHLSTGTITAIVAGSVCGVVLFVLLVIGVIRAVTLRHMRGANRRTNNFLQAAPSPATVWSMPAPYASQFGMPQWQVGGHQGTGYPTVNYVALPTYDNTMQAYADGRNATSLGQSGEVRPPSHTPACTAP